MHALLNWLWQGCVVVVALGLMLRVLERSRAHVRYLVCWTAMGIVCALPLVPWLRSAVASLETVPITAAGSIVSVPSGWWTSSAVIVAAWALWAGIYAIRLAMAMLAIWKAKRRSHVFPATVEQSLDHWTRVREHGRRSALVVSDRVRAAAVLGCGSPVIAVAPTLIQRLDADELDRVVIHEWAHVQRRDDVANTIQLIVRMIAGWHPAVWWIDRRLQLEREIACDEMTVTITGSPKSYAACLVKLVGMPLPGLRALPAPGVLTSTGLRERIVRIVSHQDFVTQSWSRIMSSALVMLLCALSLTIGGFRFVEATVVSPSAASPLPTPYVLPGQPSDSERPSMIEPTEPRVVPIDVLLPVQSATTSHHVTTPLEPLPATPTTATASDDLPPTLSVASLEAVPIDAPAALLPAQQIQLSASGTPTGSPWSGAADAGAAIGRGSKNAGVATAGFFNRFAKRIAGSF